MLIELENQKRPRLMGPEKLKRGTNPVAHSFVVPALCKVGKGRGTLCFVCVREFKDLGHPPGRRRACHWG
jgi:hypothetical protein